MTGSGGHPAGQSYVERPPVPPLAAFVSSVWIQRVAPDAAPYVQRTIPHGGVELICPVGAPPQLVGPLTAPLVAELPPGTTLVGARFHPGAAAAALGLPGSELVDRTLPGDAVWGRAATELGELVATASSPEQALARLQQVVLALVRDGAAPDPVIASAVRELMPWRIGAVGALSDALHVSPRHLRRRCEEAVGLAPKALHRTLRFQGFLALAQRAVAAGRSPTSDGGLARLAAETGYADQSHLARECVRLTGLPPRAFLGAVEDACACGHDHAASFMPLLRSGPA